MLHLSAYLDDFLADSLQLNCALRQSRKNPSILLYEDTHQEAASYLEQFQAFKPHEQFEIFLQTSLCSRKLQTFLNHREAVVLSD